MEDENKQNEQQEPKPEVDPKTVVITLVVQDGHIDSRSIFDRSIPAIK